MPHQLKEDRRLNVLVCHNPYQAKELKGQQEDHKEA